MSVYAAVVPTAHEPEYGFSCYVPTMLDASRRCWPCPGRSAGPLRKGCFPLIGHILGDCPRLSLLSASRQSVLARVSSTAFSPGHRNGIPWQCDPQSKEAPYINKYIYIYIYMWTVARHEPRHRCDLFVHDLDMFQFQAYEEF